MTTQPDLVPVRVAAARIGISDTTYRRAAAAGQVPPIVRIRGVARVGVRALDRFIDELTLAAPASHGSAAVVEAGTGGAGAPIHAGAGEQTPAPPTNNNGGTNE